jgi:hypothetical protein
VKPNIVWSLLSFLSFALNLPAQTFKSGPGSTALIELYTSEGCSSCPPADHWLGELKTAKNLWTEIVPIAFHITYWDDLGWPDPYAKPAFTTRQRNYATAWNARSVYTPEFIYQGREWHPDRATPPASRPGILVLQRNPDGSGMVTFTPIGASTAKFYEASVAVLGGDVFVKVRSGENAGRTLAHDFLALNIASLRLTRTSSGVFSASFPPPPDDLPKAGRHALAAWVSNPGDLTPLQATGGWID